MDFELYALRIFCQVIREKTFSGAARSLGITQPTVSQQIGKLETQVGMRLFERVGRDIHVTQAGKDLYGLACELLEKAHEFSDALNHRKNSPSGLVRYAMPESCQWTPHYRKIMAQIAEFPEVRFEIGILPNDQILQELLEGKLDFGFVVGDRLHPELRFEKFSDERYSAVAANRSLLAPWISGESQNLRIISYPGWEMFFTAWAKTHGLWKEFRNRLNLPTVRIGTLAGAIHAVQEGAGTAIIPTHCVSRELSNKALFEFSTKKGTASNPVHLARRTGERLPKRVELVLQLLRQAKRDLA